jgi:5-methylcytosine-specific restriction endonuclease McrA
MGIVKGSAGGKCWLCGEDVASWANRVKIPLSTRETEVMRDRFLDAAHIVADCDKGSMTPDNLRPLCPNCHRVVDRLPSARREELLRKR